MSASRARRPLFGRIGVRLTLVGVVAMLVFRGVHPWIRDWVYERWSLEFEGGPEVAELAPELARLIREPELMQQDAQLARWLTEVEQEYLAVDQAYFVLDARGDLVHRSYDLVLARPGQLTTPTPARLLVDGQEVGVSYPAIRPINLAGDRVGFLGTIQGMFDLPADAEYDRSDWDEMHLPADGSLYAERELRAWPGEDVVRRYDQLRWMVEGIVALLSALALGLLASWFLTRRLLRLSEETAHSDADGLPGPFTERGQDELAQLARAMNRMRERIGELVGGLERRDAARTEWVAQVSHDLRTPLTSLRVCLDRIDIDPDLEPERAESLRLARHDARRLHALTEDLVEAARLEVGSPLSLEPVLPREVLRAAIRSVRPLAEERGIAIATRTGGRVEECEADGERLLRACENLLRNAVRHARSHIEADAQAENGSIVLAVRDDGPGFAGGPGPVDLAEARKQGDTQEGARLGLLVVQRVAAAHGGALEIENRAAGGAEVRLRFPRRGGDA